MVRLAPGWETALASFDAILELEDENRELRRMLTALIFWIAKREDLAAFARAELDQRWPREGESTP